MKSFEEKIKECIVELEKIDISKKGYTKQFQDLYSKYGVDVVNAARENL